MSQWYWMMGHTPNQSTFPRSYRFIEWIGTSRNWSVRIHIH